MRFFDMEKVADNVDVHNKYLLTSIVAHRARQISEMKRRRLQVSAEEKYISMALDDMENDRVAVQLQAEKIPSVTGHGELPAAE